MQISRVVKFIRKGEKGDGVVSTEIRYVISLNGTTPPLDQSNWTESIPTLIKGRYLWTRTILTYSDGSKSYSYTVSYIAKDGEKGEDGKDGKDGANYLPPVWWDSEVKYVNSGFGIPVVKLEDGTTLGYSVYALTADESPAGYTPSGYPAIWRLMESSEYMFLQEAYIEKLQAELITAEKIESLHIKTGNLEVINGAKIAGLDVEGEVLVSSNKRLVIDGLDNTIYLLDDNMNIKTVIRPSNLPNSVAAFFTGTGGGNSSLAGLKGTITSNNGTRNSQNVLLPSGSMFEAHIPAITLTASVTFTPPSGGGVSMGVAELQLFLTNGIQMMSIGGAIAQSTDGTWQSTSEIASTTKSISGAGNWRLMARLEVSSIGGGTVSGTGSISSSATSFPINEVINRNEVGSNGMMIATSELNYTYMVGDLFETRRGNSGIQITNSGVRKWNGSSWEPVNW